MPFVYTFRINIAIFADINAYTSHEKKTVRFKLCHALQTIDNIVSVFFFADILPRYLFHCHEWWQNSFPISIAFLLPSSASISRSHPIWHSLLYILYIHIYIRTHSHGRLSCSHIRTIHHVFWSNDMFAHDRKNQFTLSKLFETTAKARTTHTYRCDSNIRHNFNRDQHAKQFTFCNKTPYNIGIELDGMAFFNSKLTA